MNRVFDILSTIGVVIQVTLIIAFATGNLQYNITVDGTNYSNIEGK